MNRYILCAIACAYWITGTASAAPSNQQSQQQFSAEGNAAQRNLQDQLAKEWGLSSKEYERYQELMQGPRGIWSPGLDPLTALGIEARTDEERRRFAELQVKAERERVEKELAYQRAFDEAYRRLYPGEKTIELSTAPVQSPTAESGPSLQGNGRLAVFVKDNCQACIDQVKQLQAARTPFDLYFVGSQNDDERIRRWAILAGVEPSSVKSRLITLNHDKGRWLRLGLGGDLPASVTQVGGQWQRQ
jgi:integrating conjugative element protein (TIGR03759 family)